MKPSLFISSYLPLAAYAISFPIRQVKRPFVARRDSFGHELTLNDSQDTIYMADVQVEGKPFFVQLDTGSSDLWVAIDSPMGESTGLSANISYGIGYAAGFIAKADIEFAGASISSQAYLAANDVDNAVTSYGGAGVLGMGFPILSTINAKVRATGQRWGTSLFYNIFAQNTTTSNFMTVALQRNTDSTSDVQGMFTICELDPLYAGVANTDPIPTFPPKNPERWSLLVDRIIVNGKSQTLTSAVKGVPSGSVVALVDTGTTFTYAPQPIVKALYSSIPDATLDSSSGRWVVSCDAEADISIVIGKRQFDIHPLDVVMPISPNSETCAGSWMSQELAVGASEFDILLGVSTLRSIYTVYDFGDFDPAGNMGDPYFRLWSLVNGLTASVEFHQLRGGTSQSMFTPNGNVNDASSNTNTLSSSPVDSSGTVDIEELQSKVDKLMKWAPVALGVAGLNVVLVLVGLICLLVMCCRRRKKVRGRGTAGATFIPLQIAGSSAGTQYRPVSLQGHAMEDVTFDMQKRGAAPRYNN